MGHPERSSRFSLLHADVTGADFANDVRVGLTAPHKALPPRWFYDTLGSSLFDAICFLPEYYVLRAESEILDSARREMAEAFGDRVRVVELGSGAARKTRFLLDPLTTRQPDLEYVPVDLDDSMMERSARDLLSEYPRLRVTAIRSDLTRPSAALALLPAVECRTVVLFLGSTIGNFDPDAAVALLRDLHSALTAGDALLLGADLRKAREVLEPAYDDPLGVTATFNLNLLGRINRELGGHFDLGAFRHHAFYDETLGRIEMHLVSRRSQRVAIDALGLSVDFADGESIHTENSWKHDDASLARLASAAGFTIVEKWTDSRGWFADVLMRVG